MSTAHGRAHRVPQLDLATVSDCVARALTGPVSSSLSSRCRVPLARVASADDPGCVSESVCVGWAGDSYGLRTGPHRRRIGAERRRLPIILTLVIVDDVPDPCESIGCNGALLHSAGASAGEASTEGALDALPLDDRRAASAAGINLWKPPFCDDETGTGRICPFVPSSFLYQKVHLIRCTQEPPRFPELILKFGGQYIVILTVSGQIIDHRANYSHNSIISHN